jgi:hypothetical protein
LEHRPSETSAAVRWVPGPLDGALLLALGAVIVSVTCVYVKAERVFYFWDHAVFQDIASPIASAFRASAREGWDAVRRSLDEDYNALFAVPLVPLLLVLGESRLAFEISLSVVYLLPFALAVGLLATRVAAEPSPVAFWTGAWLTILVPASWVPTLRGYPDAGGAALVVLAICAYLGDEARRRRRIAALVGGLLALAVLFRRHFVYAALAFVAAAVLDELARLLLRWRRGGATIQDDLVALSRRMVAGAFGAVITSAVVGLGFLERVRAYDFRSLYRGYEEPAGVVFHWYVAPYGWLAVALALVGLVAGARSGLLRHPQISFVALFTAVSALQWVIAVRQLGEQYTLPFTPFVVIGLAVLLWTVDLLRRPVARAAARILLTLVLAANAILGLSNLDIGSASAARPLFAGGWMPLYSWDYDVVTDLVEYLRKYSKPGEGIFVVASSRSLNPDLLRHAEWSLHGRDGARLQVLAVPQVDSRDDYPLAALLEAEHVVVVRPFQGHLRPEEQRVLTVVHELFEGGWGIARDFTRRQINFRMDDEARIFVYSRHRPTDLATALETLDLIVQRVPLRPGTQPDWAVVNRRFPSWLSRNPDGSAAWVAHPSPRGSVPSTVLAYLGREAGPIQVQGAVTFIDERCKGATLALGAADTSGEVRPLAEVRKRPGEGGRFDIRVTRPDGPRLVLSLLDHGDGASIDYCLLRIDPLVARPGRS